MPKDSHRFLFFVTENVLNAFFILFAASCIVEICINFFFKIFVFGLYKIFMIIQPGEVKVIACETEDIIIMKLMQHEVVWRIKKRKK